MKLTRRTVSHRRAWVLHLALLAFVLAQTLALLHGVMHVPAVLQLQAAVAGVNAGGAHGHGDHLLGHAQGDQQGLSCQLFDQIAQAGGTLADVAAVTPVALRTVLVAPPATHAVSRALLAFRARAPPLG